MWTLVKSPYRPSNTGKVFLQLVAHYVALEVAIVRCGYYHLCAQQLDCHIVEGKRCFYSLHSTSLTDDPGREEEVLDSLPLFLPPLPCTGDATVLRLPEGGLLAERGWDEVGGREPVGNNNKIN